MSSFVTPEFRYRVLTSSDCDARIIRLRWLLYVVVPLMLLAGCTGIPWSLEQQPAALQLERLEGAADSAAGAFNASGSTVDGRWWAGLHDPAIDRIIDTSLADSPTLGQALARIDAARGQEALSNASARPTLSLTATTGHGQAQVGNGSATETGRSSNIGAAAQWELDLFGRLRTARQAAGRRLSARNADAQAMRISVSAQIAATVINWRSCAFELQTKKALAASLTRMQKLSQQRLANGLDDIAERDNTKVSLLTAASDVTAQHAACERHVHALSTLSGLGKQEVRKQLEIPPANGVELQASYRPIDLAPDTIAWTTMLKREGVPLSAVADLQPAVPAWVVERQSTVVAALADADAAWYDIAQSRADRWPRITLSATLVRQWLQGGASSLDYTTWMLGPAISALLYDGGTAQASISAAEARYRESVAKVHAVVRTSIEDIDNALTQLQAAEEAYRVAGHILQVNSSLLAISESKWTAGSVNAFQREATWRQFALAQNRFMLAAGDRIQARIALVRATENQFLIVSNHLPEPISAPTPATH